MLRHHRTAGPGRSPRAHPLLIAAGRTALAAVLLFALSPRQTLRTVAALPARTLAVLGAGLLLAARSRYFWAAWRPPRSRPR